MPGGGQSDTWHSLQYKSKYAGEIRMEITYYDSREKPARAAERVKQTTANAPDNSRESSHGSLAGPRQPKPVVKRRPLPADPTAPHSSPVSAVDHRQTPPRAFQTPEKFITTQSPLQNIEYNAAAQQQHQSGPRQRPSEHYSHGSRYDQNDQPQSYRQPPGTIAYAPAPHSLEGDHYEIYDPQQGSEYIPGSNILDRHDEPLSYERSQPHTPQGRHNDSYDEYEEPASPGTRPPPPPAHRSHQASPAVHPLPSSNSYNNLPPQNARFDAIRQEHHRHSMPEYTEQRSYDPYSPTRESPTRVRGEVEAHGELPPRHHSFDDRYNAHDMQPYVEDAPSSPMPYSAGGPRTPQYDHRPQYSDRNYDAASSPAPRNLNGRGSAQSARPSGTPSHSSYGSHASSGSPLAYRDGSYMGSRASTSQQSLPNQYSQTSNYGSQKTQSAPFHQRPVSRGQDVSPGGHMPQLPSTLVAGMDPVISQEITDRIYSDTRKGHSSYATPPRGRHQEQHQPRQQYAHGYSRSDAPVNYAQERNSPYDPNRSSMSNGTYTPVTKPRPISPMRNTPNGSATHRAVSPNPAPGSIPRKSVSPSPMHQEQRRLSGVPFGPDAFDVLNPNVTPVKAVESAYDTPAHAIDPAAKIIMHDGREVDPSDHLPEHSWAPEPEVRTPKKTPEPPRGRPSPAGAQPMPPSGRRPLRVQPPGASPSYSSPYVNTTGTMSETNSPITAGRNRLQKRDNRAMPGGASSPLAPVSPYHDNNFNARSLPRSHTVDFVGERENGYASGSPGGYQRQGYGPPVPAKVAIPQSYGMTTPVPGPEDSAWALLEEMKSIDLGNGKGRRKRFG